MSDPQAPQRLYRNAIRESLIVSVVFFLSLVWSVGYCYLRGYRHSEDSLVVRLGLTTPRTAEEVSLIAGFPDWVFIGILVPWVLCSLFTMWFGLWGMKDDDLGAEREEEGHGHGH